MAAVRMALASLARGTRTSGAAVRTWRASHHVTSTRAIRPVAGYARWCARHPHAGAARRVHTGSLAVCAGVDGSIADVPPRDSAYSVVSDDDMAAFRGMLGGGAAAGRVVTDADELAAFNVDWMKKWGGNAPAALKPKTTGAWSVLACRAQLAVRPGGCADARMAAGRCCALRRAGPDPRVLQRAPHCCRTARVRYRSVYAHALPLRRQCCAGVPPLRCVAAG